MKYCVKQMPYGKKASIGVINTKKIITNHQVHANLNSAKYLSMR